MAGEVERLAAGLQAALEEQQAALAAKEAELRARAAAVAHVEALLAGGDVAVSPSDAVKLNVGGTTFTTSRATLTVVPDSLLGVMFSGRWEGAGGCGEEPAGPPPFLDLDPDLFAAVLSWLRMYGLGAGQQRLLEPPVAEGRKEQFMVLLDFLQLHKHIPVTWCETWCHTLHTRPMRVVGTSVTRLVDSPGGSLGVDPAHSINGAQQEQSFSKIAVAASAHSFYDVQVELDVEVVHFGADVDACLAGPMVIGVMAKSVLEQVLSTTGSSSSARGDRDTQGSSSSGSSRSDCNQRDQGTAPFTTTPAAAAAAAAAAPGEGSQQGGEVAGGRLQKVTTQPTFYGFFTNKRVSQPAGSRASQTQRHSEAWAIRNGTRRAASGQRLLWHQGDTLRVTLDCRHHREYPQLTVLNTVTLDEYSLDCCPHPKMSAATGSSSSKRRHYARGNRGANRQAQPQQQREQLQQQARQAVQPLQAPDLLDEFAQAVREIRNGVRADLRAAFEQDLAQRMLQARHDIHVPEGRRHGQQQQQAGGRGAGGAPRRVAQEGPPSPRGRGGAQGRLPQPDGGVAEGRPPGNQAPGVAAGGRAAAGQQPPAPAPAAVQANPPQQQQQQQPAPQPLPPPAQPAAAGAAAADVAPSEPPPAAGRGQAAADAAAALLPPSPSTPQEWVLVVGLSRPGDQVRLLSARRVGQHPAG